MTENSLISLYCIVDDFIRLFIETSAGKKQVAHYYGTRGPKRRMSIADIVTLNLVRIFDRTADLKTFHKNAQEHYIYYFPHLTNYENFLKATNKSAGFIAAFLQYRLHLNKLHCTEQVFYLDSTAVSVCKNHHICSHKVIKGVASRGKNNQRMVLRFQTAWSVCKRRYVDKPLSPYENIQCETLSIVPRCSASGLLIAPCR